MNQDLGITPYSAFVAERVWGAESLNSGSYYQAFKCIPGVRSSGYEAVLMATFSTNQNGV